MVGAARDRFGDPLGDIGRHAGRQDLRVVSRKPFYDLDGLLAGLSLAEDHLRETGADAAVQVELCVPAIIVGEGAEAVERLIHRQFAGFHLFEEFLDPSGIHYPFFSLSRTAFMLPIR